MSSTTETQLQGVLPKRQIDGRCTIKIICTLFRHEVFNEIAYKAVDSQKLRIHHNFSQCNHVKMKCILRHFYLLTQASLIQNKTFPPF
jgi:hypothetical protein